MAWVRRTVEAWRPVTLSDAPDRARPGGAAATRRASVHRADPRGRSWAGLYLGRRL